MIVEERRQKLLDVVSEKGFVALGDLVELLQASESTIRRDLDYWNQQGLLKRTHGGAMYLADHALPARSPPRRFCMPAGGDHPLLPPGGKSHRHYFST